MSSEVVETPETPTGTDFFVDDWLVRLELNRIERNGTSVQVEPRIFQVLVCLADNANRVVTRESLLETVWADTIVNEESLTRAISELRHVFGDNPRAPRFIETIRKGGYRLIARVNPADATQTPSAPAPVLEPASPVAAVATGLARRFAWFAAAAVLLAVLLWIWSAVQQSRSAAALVLEAIPFTSYPGEEVRPAISRDGSRVAFAWSGPDHSNFDIYVKQRNTETPLRLTEHDSAETGPVWSPDGSTIAYIRRNRDGYSIHTIPAIGGGVRTLYDGGSLIDSLDWSPDGEQLVYSERTEAKAPCRLRLLTLESQAISTLTAPPAQYTGDIRPRFSPDGASVAFVRGDRIGLNDIYTVPVSGGVAQRLTHGGSGIRGLHWAADGSEIVFSSIAKGPFSLWRVAVDDGSLTRLPVNVEWISNPSMAAMADLLVLEARQIELNVWQINIDDPTHPRHAELPLIGSTRTDTGARYSPDGNTVAFISGRSGKLEIWICNADGSDPVQLTSLGASLVGNPRWSPDGRSIAFYTPADEHSAVFVVDVAGGTPRKLSGGGSNDRVTSWSRDGRWVYFGSDRTGSWQLWKMRSDGREPVQITFDGGVTAQESVDGDEIFFVRADVGGIWSMPATGGPAALVVDCEDNIATRDWDNWIVTQGGIYFTRCEIGGHAIAYHDFESSQTRALTRLPSPPLRRSLAISPDERTILYSRVDNPEADLMMVEGFK